MTTCVNCGRDVDSQFCPDCGQNTIVLPITWKGVIISISSRWLGMDNRFARTFINLTVRPTIVINEYLAGNRVKYIGPISYLIVMTALYILSFNVFGISTAEFMQNAAETFGSAEVNGDLEATQKQQVFIGNYLSIFSSNMRLMVASIIPFIALGLSIFYRKRRNYLENFLLVSYLSSHLLWLSIIMVGLTSFFGFGFFSITFFISISYYVWVIGSLDTVGEPIRKYFKAFLCWIVSYIFFVAAMSVFAVIVVIMLLSQS